jgi:hypothetical protein
MMNLADLSRNDVLEIDGERYEVLNRTGSVFSPAREMAVELNRLGEPVDSPRFMLFYNHQEGEDLRLWERDSVTGELLDHEVGRVALLEV